jgi:hypothetical protein
MAACPDSSGPNSAPAARAASTYAPTVNGVAVTGWFLPTTHEYYQLDVSAVGGLTPGDIYWSSSYVNPSQAWAQMAGPEGGSAWSSKYGAYKVRPVRAF